MTAVSRLLTGSHAKYSEGHLGHEWHVSCTSPRHRSATLQKAERPRDHHQTVPRRRPAPAPGRQAPARRRGAQTRADRHHACRDHQALCRPPARSGLGERARVRWGAAVSAVRCPIPGYRFAPFAAWLHVRHAAETNVSLFYHAPLDTTPRRVIARRVFKNGKLRLSAGEVIFTADAGHLDRFYRLEKEAP